MDCGIYLGGPSQFELRGAILVYSGGTASNGAFASWHDVDGDTTGTPRLGPAVPLTTAFLRELSRGLGAMTRPEVLPENVLVRTPESLAWWRPAQRRKMFFRHDDELGPISGRIFPQPPLLFRVTQRELWIRALADNVRPTASTALMVAPYYNVNTEGEQSAVKCVNWFPICGYCDLCTGYFEPQPIGLDTGAENQLCPTSAIVRKFIEDPYFEYQINENLCIACAKCIEGCRLFGNGSFHLQVRHDRCLNCNECAIARSCPGDAFYRAPVSDPYYRFTT